MAGKGTIGGKIVLEGEKAYREALKQIKTEQTELRSEMKLCQSTFKDSQNSLEALGKKYEILNKQIEAQTNKIDVYKTALTESSKKEEDAAKRVSELREALSNAQKAMEDMKSSSDTTSEAVEGQKKAVEELKQKLSLAEQGYDRAVQKTSHYRTEVNNAQAELNGMQRELEATGRYMKEAENSVDQCANSIDEYGRETKEATESTSVFGDVLKANLLSSAVLEGIKKLAEGIKEASIKAVDMGSSFEASMSQVAATMGMTADEVENGSRAYNLLSDSAKECGKSTMYSASEAAEALNYLALAGYDAEKSAKTLPKVLDLAAAGGLDLAYASDLVTDSMAAMGMEADQLDNYIDQMARTSQKSNTSIAQLGEATLVCAGTVSLAGQSLETMNTELGILANNGIKGAEGGTHLRNIILSLSAPTDNAAVAIERLGIRISDSNGNMRDLNDIMIDLNRSLEGMSSTEKTQAISKIFNKTDIAAVNALLKGTGEEYDNLFKEINNCSGAAKNMADTLNNNLKGKVTILQSALEGLGISAYELFDDTMKESVDAATNAVGRLQKSIESGDMRVSLNRLSNSLGEFCNNAIEMGEDALPVIIDGFTWILDHGDILVSAITGIAVANQMTKLNTEVLGPVINTAKAAWEAYKLANEGAAVSQLRLNIAMNANPVGLLVTGITALTAAVAAYIIINKDNFTATDEVTQKTMEQAEAAKKLNETYADAADKRAKARNEIETEAQLCKKLATELKQLQSKTVLSNTEMTRQKMIVEQLNEMMPELNLVIDEHTGKLNMDTDALDKNTEAMMAMAKAEVVKANSLEIIEKQLEADKELAELRLQQEEQIKAVEEAQKRLNEAATRYEEIQATSQLQRSQEALKTLEEQIYATEESIGNFTTEYEEAMNYIAEQEALAEAASKTTQLGEAAEGTGVQIAGMSENVAAAYQSMYEDLSENIEKQMSLFDEFNGKAELSTEKLLSNMESQVKGISQWSDNLSTLADRGINQGLLQTLADMGPQGAGYVATFVEMTDDELQKAEELFLQALSLPDETAEQIAESYLLAGERAAESIKEGIEEGSESVANASGEMAEGALKEARQVLDSHSPSNETKKIGEDFDEGFIVGIEGRKAEVVLTVANMAAEMVRVAKKELQTEIFIDIGRQIPAGLVQGINSGKSSVVNAIKDMCTSAVQTAMNELDINSPSRVFAYMGEMSGEGYIEGWKQSMSEINALIAQTLPDAAMLEIQPRNGDISNMGSKDLGYGKKEINISQEINLYGDITNPLETERRFRKAQKEAAREW